MACKSNIRFKHETIYWWKSKHNIGYYRHGNVIVTSKWFWCHKFTQMLYIMELFFLLSKPWNTQVAWHIRGMLLCQTFIPWNLYFSWQQCHISWFVSTPFDMIVLLNYYYVYIHVREEKASPLWGFTFTSKLSGYHLVRYMYSSSYRQIIKSCWLWMLHAMHFLFPVMTMKVCQICFYYHHTIITYLSSNDLFSCSILWSGFL